MSLMDRRPRGSGQGHRTLGRWARQSSARLSVLFLTPAHRPHSQEPAPKQWSEPVQAGRRRQSLLDTADRIDFPIRGPRSNSRYPRAKVSNRSAWPVECHRNSQSGVFQVYSYFWLTFPSASTSSFAPESSSSGDSGAKCETVRRSGVRLWTNILSRRSARGGCSGIPRLFSSSRRACCAVSVRSPIPDASSRSSMSPILP